jgi:hypothetical protein
MKYLLLVLLLVTGIASKAQNLLSELKQSEIGYTYRTIPSYQQPGINDTITVTVAGELIDNVKLKHIDLYKMSLAASRKASGSLKEKSSYKVGEKFNIYLVKDEIKYSWEYYGENSYGAKKMNTMVVTFDLKGNFKSSVVL